MTPDLAALLLCTVVETKLYKIFRSPLLSFDMQVMRLEALVFCSYNVVIRKYLTLSELEIMTGHDIICIISAFPTQSRGGLGVTRAKKIVLCSITVKS